MSNKTKKFTIVNYTIKTIDDLFTLYYNCDNDIVIGNLPNNRQMTYRNDFKDENLAKEIVKHLNETEKFFIINDEHYSFIDNRNCGLRQFEKYEDFPKFKIIKTNEIRTSIIEVEEIF